MYIGKNYRVVLKNSRVLEGRLIVIDKTLNLCFDNCREVFNLANWKKCINKECHFCKDQVKFWDVVCVQTEMIEHIEFR